MPGEVPWDLRDVRRVRSRMLGAVLSLLLHLLHHLHSRFPLSAITSHPASPLLASTPPLGLPQLLHLLTRCSELQRGEVQMSLCDVSPAGMLTSCSSVSSDLSQSYHDRKFRQTCFAVLHSVSLSSLPSSRSSWRQGWAKVRQFGVCTGRVFGPLLQLQRMLQWCRHQVP